MEALVKLHFWLSCLKTADKATGIGLCYVLLARARGAKKVIIADIALSEKARQVVQEDTDVVYQKCDVLKWHELQALIDDCKTRFGDVPDVFVASAGVLEPVANILLSIDIQVV